jgi:serine/threonine protein kinase
MTGPRMPDQVASPCLSEHDAIDCATGLGDVDQRRRWDEHLDACIDCRQLISLLAGAPSTEPMSPGPPHSNAGVRFRGGQTMGRFELRRPIGAGGMAIVFEAFDPVLNRSVAVKLLRSDRLRDRTRAHERLVRESRALAKLNHPNVVTVYEAGVHGDEVYLVMELVAGPTLAEWLETPRRWRDVVDIFVQVGKGLAAAHAIGLVHRDVKPMNILLGEDGRARIGDFGVVAHADDMGVVAESEGTDPSHLDDRDPMTQPGTVVGTPAYIAPEVRLGSPATALSDQWSFATSLWGALGGDGAHRIPRWLRAVVARGRTTEPPARWPSIDAMVSALVRRRHLAIRLGVGALALAVAALWAGTRLGTVQDPCEDADSALAGVWGPARQLELQRVFLATGNAAAAQIAADVRDSIDERVRSWRELRHVACSDPQPRASEAPADEPSARMECLDRQLAELRATIDQMLVKLPVARLGSAVDVAQNLPHAEECASAERLLKGERLPRDPDLRHKLEELRDQLERAKADWFVNANPAALAVAQRVAREAAGFAPLRASALTLAARVQRTRGDAAIIDTVRQASVAADEAGDEILQAEVALTLVDSYRVVAQPPADTSWALQQAEARITAVARIASKRADRLRPYYLVARGTIEYSLKQYDLAIRDFRDAVTIGRKVFGPDSWWLARARGTFAASLLAKGKYQQAVDEIEATLPVLERYLSPDHPELARQYIQAMGASYMAGNLPRALELGHRARAIAEHVALPAVQIPVLDVLADVEMATGDAAAGIQALEAELPLLEHVPATGIDPARIRARIACARLASTAQPAAAGATRAGLLLQAAACFHQVERPQIEVPLLERAVADLSETATSTLDLRVRFALARALGDRGQDGDLVRAHSEAARARRDCARVPQSLQLAKEIDAWVAATPP